MSLMRRLGLISGLSLASALFSGCAGDKFYLHDPNVPRDPGANSALLGVIADAASVVQLGQGNLRGSLVSAGTGTLLAGNAEYERNRAIAEANRTQVNINTHQPALSLNIMLFEDDMDLNRNGNIEPQEIRGLRNIENGIVTYNSGQNMRLMFFSQSNTLGVTAQYELTKIDGNQPILISKEVDMRESGMGAGLLRNYSTGPGAQLSPGIYNLHISSNNTSSRQDKNIVIKIN